MGMDPVLALILGCLLTLTVGGSGVLLWQLSKRLKRVEERLEAMQVLSLLPDRVQALARVVTDLNPNQIREEFERIHTALARLEALAASPAGVATPGASREEAVRALVHRWLRDEGYRSARILKARLILLETLLRYGFAECSTVLKLRVSSLFAAMRW